MKYQQTNIMSTKCVVLCGDKAVSRHFNSQLTNTKTRQLTRKRIMCITLLYIVLN